MARLSQMARKASRLTCHLWPPFSRTDLARSPSGSSGRLKVEPCTPRALARSLARDRRAGGRNSDRLFQGVDVVGAVMAATVDEEGGGDGWRLHQREMR